MGNARSDFQHRVNIAALYISRGAATSRAFSNCFEHYDGDAVAVALFRRAEKAPEGDLAKNLWRYLCRESVSRLAAENAHRQNLAAWARDLAALA